ncbi:ABC transporter permease [Streptomyces platensis]|uniref:ABC transporter permease n=1 Tax=Streptomyces platensis TaxID=58346 RepID=UPI001F19F7C0|nr:ABC transporter permease [Streptomyces platensis]MCF3142465.1 ABC transporter permease [Streptomyces platensis]
MNLSALPGLTAGDFKDRVRRPVYLVVLLAAVGLGYLAVPPADGRWVILALGEYRGTYNSAYVGVATALAGALWLTLGGFYVVRKGIARDEETRVGQILAATPVRTTLFLASKFLSSFLVLASMLGVLAVTALAMQLVRGEDRGIDLVALFKPFLVMALPLLALTAAAAVLFETVPVLRGGVGNVIWFFVALVVGIGGQSSDAPLGGLGVGRATDSMGAALTEELGKGGDRAFSLGLTQVAEPLRPFRWDGFELGGGLLTSRLLIVVIAVALALLPALWFGRFDPSRDRRGAAARVSAEDEGDAGSLAGADTPGPAVPMYRPAPTAALTLPKTATESGGTFGRLLAGEVRILVGGVSPWWWVVAAALTVAGLAVPGDLVTGLVLPAVWIWPVLIWSRLGSQQVEHGMEGLLGAYPAVRRRLLAEWGSGVVLTAVLGVAPLIRMALAGDAPGLAAWLAGVLFIPSLAMLLGVVCRTHRVFQAVYLPIWYLVVNKVAAVDFMGAVRDAGAPAGPTPLFYAAALLMLGAAFLAAETRRNLTA